MSYLAQGQGIGEGGELTAAEEAWVQAAAAGVIALPEISAPSATTNYGKIYVKTDNLPYYLSEAGVETGILTTSSGAPIGATYVTLSTNASLTNERVLTGTTNQVTLTDNGAGSTVVVSLPQDIATNSSVTFGNVTLGTGGALRTGTTAGNTLLLQAYDNDTGPGYITFATLTAGNTPTFDLNTATTIGTAYIYRAGGTDIPVTDGGTGLSAISALSVWVANSANTITEVTPGAGNAIRINAGGTAWEAYTPSAVAVSTFTVANEATDTTCFPIFVTAATGDLGPKTNASLTYNSNTGSLASTTFVGALTGNATTATTLATARAIYGNNFDGSAALTQVIASTYGGTGNGFTKFSGPTTAEKTFTLPDASATILTSAAVVTPAQGGTGIANNNASTLTISGNFATTLTVTNTTTVTLPTTGTLYGTATGSITSAQLAGSLTDETGTGVAVFATAPVFPTTITVGAASGATGQILLKGTTSGTVTLKTADAAGTYTLTLPTDDGTASQVLSTDGSGVLSWTTVTSGTTTGGTTQELTDAATIAWNMASGNFASVLLGGNRTLGNPTNDTSQTFARIIVKQDGTGSRTLAYSSKYLFTGAAPTLTTTPYLVDILDFQSYQGAMMLVNIQKGYGSVAGYYSGGATSNGSVVVTTTDALAFASDSSTMVTRGALSVATYLGGGAGSATVAYFSGGGTTGATAVTHGLTFVTDTTAQVTKGALTVATNTLGAVKSSTVAYFSGGNTGDPVTTTNGLTFATDTTTMVTKGVLTTARGGLKGANSTTIGYFTGGFNAGYLTTTDGLTFASDTTTMVTKGVLGTATNKKAGANSPTVAYFTGGDTGAYVTTTSGLTFATDTTTMATKGVLGTARGEIAGTNSSTIAYFSGGRTGGGFVNVDTTEALTFATDTTTMAAKGALSQARSDIMSAQGTTVATQVI